MEVQPSGLSPMPMQTVAIMLPPPRKGILLCLSIVQIIIGIITIFCGTLSNGILDHDIIVRIGAPNWGGCWIVVTGVIGISFSKSGTFIAFNVVSTVITSVTLYFCAGEIAYYSQCGDYTWRDIPKYNNPCWNARDNAMGLYMTLIILMSIEFFISIIAAAFSCKYTACCCRQRNQDDMNQQLTSYVSSNAYCPTSSYPQHTGVTTYPGQMVSQPPTYVACVSARGQQMPAGAYSSQMLTQPPTGSAYAFPQGQQISAQTNIGYSAQSDFNKAPPPCNY